MSLQVISKCESRGTFRVEQEGVEGNFLVKQVSVLYNH